MTKLNPPMGFTSCDWSEEIGTDKLMPGALFEPDEAVLERDFRLGGPIPMPLSADGGQILDWSRNTESESLAHSSTYRNRVVHRE